jgi:hypothetical protein
MAERLPELSECGSLDVAYRVDRDEWNGGSRLVAKLADFVVAPR